MWFVIHGPERIIPTVFMAPQTFPSELPFYKRAHSCSPDILSCILYIQAKMSIYGQINIKFYGEIYFIANISVEPVILSLALPLVQFFPLKYEVSRNQMADYNEMSRHLLSHRPFHFKSNIASNAKYLVQHPMHICIKPA